MNLPSTGQLVYVLGGGAVLNFVSSSLEFPLKTAFTIEVNEGCRKPATMWNSLEDDSVKDPSIN